MAELGHFHLFFAAPRFFDVIAIEAFVDTDATQKTNRQASATPLEFWGDTIASVANKDVSPESVTASLPTGASKAIKLKKRGTTAVIYKMP